MAILAKKIQPAKAEAIKAAKDVLSAYNDYIFADYRGLTVEQITALRDKLREKEATFKVIKNNFARVAFEEMEITNVAEYLTGPTAIAMAKEDSNEAAKILFDFAKDAPALKVKGAYVGKEVYDAAKILLKGSGQKAAYRNAYVCYQRSGTEDCRYLAGIRGQKISRRRKLSVLLMTHGQTSYAVGLSVPVLRLTGAGYILRNHRYSLYRPQNKSGS